MYCGQMRCGQNRDVVMEKKSSRKNTLIPLIPTTGILLSNEKLWRTTGKQMIICGVQLESKCKFVAYNGNPNENDIPSPPARDGNLWRATGIQMKMCGVQLESYYPNENLWRTTGIQMKMGGVQRESK